MLMGALFAFCSVLCVFPFYGATDGRLLVSRRHTGRRYGTHGLDKLTGRPLARRSYAAFVEPAAILELAVGIVTEEVRRPDRPICPRDCLRLVAKIGKWEIMSLRETLHILKRIFGIARRIVRANRRKAYAFRHQHAGVRNHAVDHRFDIRTMIADENDDRALFARNVVQYVNLTVGGRKPKLRRRRIENDWCSCCRHIGPPCTPKICQRGAWASSTLNQEAELPSRCRTNAKALAARLGL